MAKRWSAAPWAANLSGGVSRCSSFQRASSAAYLCELHGAPIQAEDNTAMPTAFLIQQMEWRESLEEARSAAELDALDEGVQQARGEALALCGQLLDQQADYAGAARQVRALMFIARFADDIERRRDQLGQ